MEWLAAQFHDRAADDPSFHTELDATQVEAARAAFTSLLSSLKVLVEQMESTSAWEDALNGEDPYLAKAMADAEAAIAAAEQST